MPPLLLFQFTPILATSAEEPDPIWYAFSSSDPDRTSTQLYYDACYWMGYQISHPEDKDTCLGLLINHTIFHSELTLAERAQGLHFVALNQIINTEFAIRPVSYQYPDVAEDEGVMCYAQHHELNPNNELVIPPDPDSDSD
jgi:hypothetical protein